MSSEQQLNQVREELISAGFKPARYAVIVKLIRRFVWPVIRPFAFFLLDKILLLQQQIDETHKNINEDIARLVSERLVLRSDVAASKNLYTNNSPSHEQLALLGNDVDVIKSRLNDAHNRSRYLVVTNTKSGLFIGKPGEIISDHIFAGGDWDSHIVTLAQDVSKTSPGIAVDVGAHFGTITLALSGLFKEVLSFEPNDFNYYILRGNIALNRIENVRLFNYGLYSKEEILSLGEQWKQEIAIPVNSSGDFDGYTANNLGAYLFSEGCDRPFAHFARTLDSFGLSDVSFIKIDVQGADGEVLMGSMDTIRRCRPVIVFEWEDHLSRNFSVSFDTLHQKFLDLDYKLSILKMHNEKQIDYVAFPQNIEL
jgi:FkbM family methyltransferase